MKVNHENNNTSNMNISIFGLGYVGCVGIGCLSKQGHSMVGVDVSDVKVEKAGGIYLVSDTIYNF